MNKLVALLAFVVLSLLLHAAPLHARGMRARVLAIPVTHTQPVVWSFPSLKRAGKSRVGPVVYAAAGAYALAVPQFTGGTREGKRRPDNALFRRSKYPDYSAWFRGIALAVPEIRRPKTLKKQLPVQPVPVTLQSKPVPAVVSKVEPAVENKAVTTPTVAQV